MVGCLNFIWRPCWCLSLGEQFYPRENEDRDKDRLEDDQSDGCGPKEGFSVLYSIQHHQHGIWRSFD